MIGKAASNPPKGELAPAPTIMALATKIINFYHVMWPPKWSNVPLEMLAHSVCNWDGHPTCWMTTSHKLHDIWVCGDSIWQNRPPVIFADLPEDGMHTSVGHNLYTQMGALDVSMIERARDATSVDVYTWKPCLTAIDPSMIERAPGVTFEDIDQHRVCGVASASFNADFTKLTPSQDVFFLNDHS